MTYPGGSQPGSGLPDSWVGEKGGVGSVALLLSVTVDGTTARHQNPSKCEGDPSTDNYCAPRPEAGGGWGGGKGHPPEFCPEEVCELVQDTEKAGES